MCKCAHGLLHGPYWYRFWRDDGRLHKQYVPLADVAAVTAACASYRDTQRCFRAFRDAHRCEWSRMARQLREMIRESVYG
jgi:hypothetical protein